MQKALQFLKLYLFAVFKWLEGPGKAPKGVHGSIVTLFLDPANQKAGLHGVVAFVLDKGTSPDDYSRNLWGPFGFSNAITVNGQHLYGLDTWGTANPNQIRVNLDLRDLAAQHPGQIIQLAGVRKLGLRHIWPLNRPEKFVLPRL